MSAWKNIVYMMTMMEMMMICIFDNTCGKLNMVGIFMIGNYAQKWFSELCYGSVNYIIINLQFLLAPA
jgi:hypothetical protein